MVNLAKTQPDAMYYSKIAVLTLIFVSQILILGSCSSFSAGFGPYEKPWKICNKYYRRHFKLTNQNLIIGRPYRDRDITYDSLTKMYTESYFIFYSNGFVLHNSGIQSTNSTEKIINLNYSEIFSEDVGSYIIKGDTVLWATKAGYMKRHRYYSALIVDNGLKIITCPNYIKTKFLTLQ